MAKLLFVVHRMFPYPGGSEYYVNDMAQEASRRGHDVTVLAGTHKGNVGNVKVTDDLTCLMAKWDLVIIHGADCHTQDIAHINAANIKSPTLYMIIKPSNSPRALHGIEHHDFLGYSTQVDFDFLLNANQRRKMHRIRHGINKTKIDAPNFRKQFGINTPKMFVSVGGFYPHKRMHELATTFSLAGIPDTTLCLFGYSEHEPPRERPGIRVFQGLSKEVIHDAIADADLYIMNSSEEGFGLVLLEAMMLKTPWIANCVGAAQDLSKYGMVYRSDRELTSMMLHDKHDAKGYDYVMANHTIEQTVNDIEDLL